VCWGGVRLLLVCRTLRITVIVLPALLSHIVTSASVCVCGSPRIAKQGRAFRLCICPCPDTQVTPEACPALIDAQWSRVLVTLCWAEGGLTPRAVSSLRCLCSVCCMQPPASPTGWLTFPMGSAMARRPRQPRARALGRSEAPRWADSPPTRHFACSLSTLYLPCAGLAARDLPRQQTARRSLRCRAVPPSLLFIGFFPLSGERLHAVEVERCYAGLGRHALGSAPLTPCEGCKYGGRGRSPRPRPQLSLSAFTSVC